MVLSEPSYDGVILKAVGPAAVGITGTTHWNADFDNEASKAMVAAWAAAYPGYAADHLCASRPMTPGC